MDFRVQGFHATIEHFWKAGVVGHLGDGQASVRQQFGRTAGRQQLDVESVQFLREFKDAGFVRD